MTKRRYINWRPEMRKDALSLFQRDMSYREIADEISRRYDMDINPGMVQSQIRRMGYRSSRQYRMHDTVTIGNSVFTMVRHRPRTHCPVCRCNLEYDPVERHYICPNGHICWNFKRYEDE